MLYFHKIIPLLLSPLGFTVLLIFIGICIRRNSIIATGGILLVVSSLPLTANLLWTSLESSYPPKKVSELDSQETVIVLSGGLQVSELYKENFADWIEPDRFFGGLDVINAKKANKLIFTNGRLPWSELKPEGEFLRERAINFGVNESQVFLTSLAQNTKEEAVVSKRLLEGLSVTKTILVTSSFHMPRATLLFSQQGIEVEPYPVDFKAVKLRFHILNLLPNADSLQKTSRGIREYIGRGYYSTIYLFKNFSNGKARLKFQDVR